MGFALHDIIAVGGCSVSVGVSGQGQILAQKEDRVGEELGGHVGKIASLRQVGPVPAAPLAVVAQVGTHSAAAG